MVQVSQLDYEDRLQAGRPVSSLALGGILNTPADPGSAGQTLSSCAPDWSVTPHFAQRETFRLKLVSKARPRHSVSDPSAVALLLAFQRALHTPAPGPLNVLFPVATATSRHLSHF